MGTLSQPSRTDTHNSSKSFYIQGVNMKLTSMLMMLMGIMMMMMTVMDGVAAGECKDKLDQKRCSFLKKMFNICGQSRNVCDKTCGKCPLPSKTGGCKDVWDQKRCSFLKITTNICRRSRNEMNKGPCDLTCGFTDC